MLHQLYYLVFFAYLKLEYANHKGIFILCYVWTEYCYMVQKCLVWKCNELVLANQIESVTKKLVTKHEGKTVILKCHAMFVLFRANLFCTSQHSTIYMYIVICDFDVGIWFFFFTKHEIWHKRRGLISVQQFFIFLIVFIHLKKFASAMCLS